MATKQCVVLRKLPSEVLGYVQRSCKLVRIEANQAVYVQGEPSLDFFIVQTGRYRVTVTGPDGVTQQLVREYGMGDTFGSHELLLGKPPRSVGVTALEDGSLWVIPDKVFAAKLRLAPAPAPSLVEKVRNVTVFEGLSTEKLTLLCRAVSNVTITKGNPLHAKGDASDDVLALIEGQLKLTSGDDDEATNSVVKAPHCFGEEAFHPDAHFRVRSFNASAWAGAAVLLKFNAADVEALLGYELQMKLLRQTNLSLLKNVVVHKTPLLGGLTEADCEWLSSMMVSDPPHKPGESIVREGDTDERLYIIYKGEVAVSTMELGDAGKLERGQYFGELALTGRKHKRSATITAQGPDVVQLLSLSMSAVRSNPKLEWWTKHLDVAAASGAKMAQASGAGEGKPPAKGRVKAGSGDKEGIEPTALNAKSQVARRRSMAEMLVETQRAAINAAKKAAREATARSKRENKFKSPHEITPSAMDRTSKGQMSHRPTGKQSKTGVSSGGVIDKVTTVLRRMSLQKRDMDDLMAIESSDSSQETAVE